MKNIHIWIISNMLEFPAKGISSANQVRASDHFYDYKLHKIVGKQWLVTMDQK